MDNTTPSARASAPLAVRILPVSFVLGAATLLAGYMMISFKHIGILYPAIDPAMIAMAVAAIAIWTQHDLLLPTLMAIFLVSIIGAAAYLLVTTPSLAVSLFSIGIALMVVYPFCVITVHRHHYFPNS